MQSDQLSPIGADMTSATSLSLSVYNLGITLCPQQSKAFAITGKEGGGGSGQYILEIIFYTIFLLLDTENISLFLPWARFIWT